MHIAFKCCLKCHVTVVHVFLENIEKEVLQISSDPPLVQNINYIKNYFLQLSVRVCPTIAL